MNQRSDRNSVDYTSASYQIEEFCCFLFNLLLSSKGSWNPFYTFSDALCCITIIIHPMILINKKGVTRTKFMKLTWTWKYSWVLFQINLPRIWFWLRIIEFGITKWTSYGIYTLWNKMPCYYFPWTRKYRWKFLILRVLWSGK